MEEFINNYFDLRAKMKLFFGEEYETFQNVHLEAINDINQDIKMAKLLKPKISEVESKKPSR